MPSRVIERWPNGEVGTAEVAALIAVALEQKRPLSLISLCDGEAQVLWAALGFQTFHCLASLGFPPEERGAVAHDLVAAVKRADIVCIPRSGPAARTPPFRDKLLAGLGLWGARPKADALIGDSLVCFYLAFDAWLWGLIEGRRILIVNNRADQVVNVLLAGEVPEGLRKYVAPGWIRVAEATPVLLEIGQAGSAKAIAESEKLAGQTDLVLVGAGARAAHLCVEIAERLAVPAIELGGVLRLLHEEYYPGGWDKVYGWYQEAG